MEPGQASIHITRVSAYPSFTFVQGLQMQILATLLQEELPLPTGDGDVSSCRSQHQD